MRELDPHDRFRASTNATLGSMPADTPLARWLREEMPRRGYPLEGPRAGGITRLADVAGISRPSLSRIVAGHAEQPSVDALRKIGRALGYSLGDMMIHAGLATPEDVATQVTVGPVRAAADIPRPAVEIPPDVNLQDVPVRERHIWELPDLTVEQREALILFMRLQLGELQDDTGSLLALYRAIGKIVDRHLEERHDPPRAG